MLFPLALVEPVVRGAYADALREGGQLDKATTEEQGAVSDLASRQSRIVAPPYNPLTDQDRPKPRYRYASPT
jgi:hypothetical protein